MGVCFVKQRFGWEIKDCFIKKSAKQIKIFLKADRIKKWASLQASRALRLNKMVNNQQDIPLWERENSISRKSATLMLIKIAFDFW